MLSLVLPLFSSEHRGLVSQLSQYYDQLWNVTVATDYDEEGCTKLLAMVAANQTKAGDYDYLFKFGASPVVRSTMSLSLMPTSKVLTLPRKQATRSL
jgi:hypothetical protein